MIVGDPSKPGPYLIRVKAPSGVKLMPHSHPEDGSTRSFPECSTSAWAIASTVNKLDRPPARQRHRSPRRHAAFSLGEIGRIRDPVSAIGPLGLDYLDPRDDPRGKASVRNFPERNEFRRTSNLDATENNVWKRSRLRTSTIVAVSSPARLRLSRRLHSA